MDVIYYPTSRVGSVYLTLIVQALLLLVENVHVGRYGTGLH